MDLVRRWLRRLGVRRGGRPALTLPLPQPRRTRKDDYQDKAIHHRHYEDKG